MATGIESALDPQTREFYCRSVGVLQQAGVPFLVGGAYAFAAYTGIERHTKDFDIFVRRSDYERTMAVLADIGYHTELTFPHWLGKAYQGEHFIDVIFSSGNGVAAVDDAWFEHATSGEVLGLTVQLSPAEEMLWSKSFVMERERYDGADIAHLLRARATKLDWQRLLDRFGPYWRVLLGNLVMFGFIYPEQRGEVPAWVMDRLLDRLRQEQGTPAPGDHVCRGTLISRAQYLIDVDQWGYRDARAQPEGAMSEQDIAHWTAGIEQDGH